MTDLHINAPSFRRLRQMSHCPICKATTRFVVRVYEWYEPSSTCLECGDNWQGGELSARPFLRGWREKSRVDAAKEWTFAEWPDPGHDANGAPISEVSPC